VGRNSRWLIVIPAIGFALFAKPAKADVLGNWTFSQSQNCGGSVEVVDNSIVLHGPDGNGCSGQAHWVKIETTIPANVDTIYFTWTYQTNDGPYYDPPQIGINGVYKALGNFWQQTQNGSASIPVHGGDVFTFRQYSVDTCCQPGNLTISNLSLWVSTTTSTSTTTTSTTTVPETTVPATVPTTTTVPETTTTSTTSTTVLQTTTSTSSSSTTTPSSLPTTTTTSTTTTSSTLPATTTTTSSTTTSTSTTSVPQTITTSTSVPQTTSTESTTTTTEQPAVPTPVTVPEISEPESVDTVVPEEPEPTETGTTSTTVEEATPETTLPEETTTTTEPSPETTFQPVVDTTLPEATDTPLEAPLSDEEVDSLIAEAETTEALVEALANLAPEQVAQVVEALLAGEPSQEQATALATSPEVLAIVSTEQAAQIFEALDVAELSDAQTEALIAAVQDAPTSIRNTFEDKIDIFKNALDTYVPVGSTIPVGTRRTLIAITAGISLAAAGTRIRRQ